MSAQWSITVIGNTVTENIYMHCRSTGSRTFEKNKGTLAFRQDIMEKFMQHFLPVFSGAADIVRLHGCTVLALISFSFNLPIDRTKKLGCTWQCASRWSLIALNSLTILGLPLWCVAYVGIGNRLSDFSSRSLAQFESCLYPRLNAWVGLWHNRT